MALAILILCCVCVSGALASTSVRFNTDAKVYASASTSSRSVHVSKGQKVTLKSYANGWAEVSSHGVTGYTKLRNLDLVSAIRVYTTDKVKVYRKAGSDSMGTVAAGTAMYAFGIDGNYAHVRNKSGSASGYVRLSQLSTTRPAVQSAGEGGGSGAGSIPDSLKSSTTSKSASKIEYTIYIAQNLLGAPYASDANPPKTFDCAKYAHYCYGKAQHGALKGSSKAQGYDDRYDLVEYDALKRGDLVCFDTINDSDLSDHVGIYLGNGYFLHASSSAKKVIMSSLKSGYYKRTFSWGRRIFED